MSKIIKIKVKSNKEWITTVSPKKDSLILASEPVFQAILKLIEKHPNRHNKANVDALKSNAEPAVIKGYYCYPSKSLLKKLKISSQNVIIFKEKNNDFYKLYSTYSFKKSILADIDNWKTRRPAMLTLDIGNLNKYIYRLL